MKKLTKVELNVLSMEIGKKVNEAKYERVKDELEKDVDYVEMKKLNDEMNVLSKLLVEKNKLFSSLGEKVREKFGCTVVKDNKREIKVIYSNNGYSYYNDLVLTNIGKEFNVEELINKVVEKYIS